MSTTGRIATVVTAGTLVLGMASGVFAQKVTREPVRPVAGVAGSVSFNAYCAQCHGVSGKGNGPAAAALKVTPADLTQLAKQNGGKFDAAAVKSAITGDRELLAHGTRDMPMWGPVLRSVDSPEAVELRIRNLVEYLEQMQEKK